jgi:hypothetical protein
VFPTHYARAGHEWKGLIWLRYPIRLTEKPRIGLRLARWLLAWLVAIGIWLGLGQPLGGLATGSVAFGSAKWLDD